MKKLTIFLVFMVLGVFLVTGNIMAVTTPGDKTGDGEKTVWEIIPDGFTAVEDSGYYDFSNGATFTILAEEAGWAGSNSFGYYQNQGDTVEVFAGTDGVGASEEFETLGSGIGVYIDTNDGTFYSDPALNADGYDHFLAFVNEEGQYIWAIEDLNFNNPRGVTWWDHDHNDMVVSSVPIPGAVWLFASGLIGLLGIRRGFASQ
jgi:hypothetical protein